MREDDATRRVEAALRRRNDASRRFFAREADRLAAACRDMAERFRRGGRLLAFGRGPHATDAQHVAVEFVHPVIVGKRALPALDLSLAFERWLPALVRANDVAMAFGPPGGDAAALSALETAARAGAMTFALPSAPRAAFAASYGVETVDEDPFVHQELLEVLYHTLWETVHVYLEHEELGRDAGAASFLYPFLGSGRKSKDHLLSAVASSIRAKAADDERLREEVASEQAAAIARASLALDARVRAGGALLLFGNGGSATDANDWAIDCALGTAGGRAIPAVSLAMEPAILSAVANDIGAEAMFLRQLIAQGRPEDVAIAISTSGGSRNVIAALEEARRRDLATVALLGYDGGEAVRRGLADHSLVVRCDYIPRIQEIQASIYHVVLEVLAALQREDEGERERARTRDQGPGTAVAAVVAANPKDRRRATTERARPETERREHGELDGSASSASAGGLREPHAPDAGEIVDAARSQEGRHRRGTELYGGTSCPFTAELREQLAWEGREFVEHDVDADPRALEHLRALVPGAPRVPVLVVDGRVVEVGWQGRSCLVGAGGACDLPASVLRREGARREP